MAKLNDLLANRRIPGEIHHRRMDPSLQEELAATDPSIEEVRYTGRVGRGRLQRGKGEGATTNEPVSIQAELGMYQHGTTPGVRVTKFSELLSLESDQIFRFRLVSPQSCNRIN